VNDALLRIGGESLFKGFDRTIEPATALEAPTERQPSLDHTGIGRHRGLKRLDSLGISFGRSEGLATQQVRLRTGRMPLRQPISISSDRWLDACESEPMAPIPLPQTSRSGPDSLGFPKDLLPAYPLYCNHGGVLQDGPFGNAACL